MQVSIDNSRFDNNAIGVSALDFTYFSVTNSQAFGQQPGWLSGPGEWRQRGDEHGQLDRG